MLFEMLPYDIRPSHIFIKRRTRFHYSPISHTVYMIYLFIYSFKYFSCLATSIDLLISLFADLTSFIVIHLLIYLCICFIHLYMCVWGGGANR